MKLSLLSLSLILTTSNGFATKKPKSSLSGGGGGGGFGANSKSKLVHTPDMSDSTQNLVQFLKNQNSKGLGNVEIGYHRKNGVRGLFATKNFKKGQIICQIPSNCALALSDPSKNGEDAPTLIHEGANFLSMYLNDEQAKQMWDPYLNTLPAQGSNHFDPTPDFFTDDELDLLEFPRIIQQAKGRKEDIEKLAKVKGLDKDDLQYAVWLTASRKFSISIATKSVKEEKAILENKSLRVMVPFIGTYVLNDVCVGYQLSLFIACQF